MPNPRTGTVTFEIETTVKEVKAGKVEFRVNKEAGVHVGIGKVSFTEEMLKDNLVAVLQAIIRAKPGAAKGTYLRKAAIASTMGLGIRLNTTEITQNIR